MLRISNISSGYGKKQVLYDVSLEVNAGEVVWLTGGNGSGKSTLLNCIYNLLPLWSGSIEFEGERIDILKPSDLIRKGIVYIPQKDFCFENLTIEENLQIAGNIYQRSELKHRIEKVYDQTGLGPYKKRKPFNLSGGEKKLLAFGMGLVHHPKLVLFDEPFAGVDIAKSNIIKEILKSESLINNIATVFVEHKSAFTLSFTKEVKLELGILN